MYIYIYGWLVKARGATPPNGRCGSWEHGRPSNRPSRHPEVASRSLSRPASSTPSAGTGQSDCDGGEQIAPAQAPNRSQDCCIVMLMVGISKRK